MRTNVVINDDLIESALKISGIKTKKGRRRKSEAVGSNENPREDKKFQGQT